MKSKRQAYFLDYRILKFIKEIPLLIASNDKEVYLMLKAERDYGSLKGVRLCHEKTFYKWLADGRKELREFDLICRMMTSTDDDIEKVERLHKKLSKVAQLAEAIYFKRVGMTIEARRIAWEGHNEFKGSNHLFRLIAHFEKLRAKEELEQSCYPYHPSQIKSRPKIKSF